MEKYIIISVVSFLQVLLVAFQQRNIAQGRTLVIFLTSLVIGTLLVFLQRNYIVDDISALCFIIFGSFGAVSGVWLHKKVFKNLKDKNNVNE